MLVYEETLKGYIDWASCVSPIKAVYNCGIYQKKSLLLGFPCIKKFQ